MALKPFYNKKGHLGMTRQQVKAALNKKLYQHIITLTSHSGLILVTNDSTPFTKETLYTYLLENGYDANNKYLETVYATAPYSDANKLLFSQVYGIFAYTDNSTVRYMEHRYRVDTTLGDSSVAFSVTALSVAYGTVSTIIDNVIEIK